METYYISGATLRALVYAAESLRSLTHDEIPTRIPDDAHTADAVEEARSIMGQREVAA